MLSRFEVTKEKVASSGEDSARGHTYRCRATSHVAVVLTERLEDPGGEMTERGRCNIGSQETVRVSVPLKDMKQGRGVWCGIPGWSRVPEKECDVGKSLRQPIISVSVRGFSGHGFCKLEEKNLSTEEKARIKEKCLRYLLDIFWAVGSHD